MEVYGEIDPIFIVIALIVAIISIAGMWRVYQKAGEPGWAVIVPIYNYYVFSKIIGKPGYWTILFLIPYVNYIFLIWGNNLLAKKFGKTEGFTVGLVLLPFIFYPILGFGDAQYEGGNSSEASDDVLDA